jgi:hypothetical protein
VNVTAARRQRRSIRAAVTAPTIVRDRYAAFVS